MLSFLCRIYIFFVQLDLQITSVYMDNRVSDLEKHDGGAVNSSGGGNYHDGWFTRLENTIDQQGQSLTFVEADIKGKTSYFMCHLTVQNKIQPHACFFPTRKTSH